MKYSMKTSLFLSLVFCLCQINLNAQFKPQTKSESPYFLIQGSGSELDQMPLKRTAVDVKVAGVIADVTVTQVYKNEGVNPIEAVYVFPGSTNAAVYGMQMQIGERTIVAQIREKNQARKEYEQAKSEGKRASLLEQHRPNVFQMNVANIMPGDEVKVILNYTEKLIPEEGIYSFVYPTVVGPRYTNPKEATASNNSSFTNMPFTKSGQHPTYEFDLNMNISAGMPIQDVTCITHAVQTKFDGFSKANISLEASEKFGGNRDFILDYQLSGGNINSGLLLYEHEDEKFFMLTVQPPKTIVENQILPREYIFIVDISGSMNGFPLDVSKKLLRNLISNLRSFDRFNILLFAGSSKFLADESWAATPDNLNKAINFIDNQRGGGSTQLLPAMKKAMSFKRCDENLSRSLIIVTDGYVSADQNVLDFVGKNLNQANVFAFGIGSSVNRHLIDGLANAGQSHPLIVLNQNAAAGNAEKFRKYISTPVLSNIKVDFEGFDAYDVSPKSFPDLMGERPIVIQGKYKGDLKGNIKIGGTTTGKDMNTKYQVTNYAPSRDNQAIRYLWAREEIKVLDDYNRFKSDNSRIAKVTQLGLKYNLMTAYTSFIAIDRIIANAAKQQNEVVKQVSPMPQNVPNSAIGFEMELEEVVVASKKKKVKKAEVVTIDNMKFTIPAEVTESIQKQIKKHLNELKWCGKSGEQFNLVFEITIDKNGKVLSIKTLRNSGEKYQEVCLIENIWNWSFELDNQDDTIQFQLPISLNK